MNDCELFKFCEDYNISIRKFLMDNYNFSYTIDVRNNKRNRHRYRLKHEEISCLDNIIEVPLKFAFKYKDLVLKGKILIVEDEFGIFKAYLNPMIIADACKIDDVINEIHNNQNDLIYLNSLYTNLEEIKEDIRLIERFNGTDILNNNRTIYKTIKSIDRTLVRKKELK